MEKDNILKTNKMQEKTNWYNNGKFTAICSLIVLIFLMIIFTSAFFIYNLHPNVINHQFLKDTLYSIMWYFGLFIILFCVGALLKRGWTFFSIFLQKYKSIKN